MTVVEAETPRKQTTPLRILMVISGYPPRLNAGAEKGCRRLSEALARRGQRVHVLTQETESLPPVTEEEKGLTVLRVLKPSKLGPLWGLSYMSQIKRWMKKLASEYDLVMCHQLYLHSAVVSRVAKKLGKKSCTLLVNSGENSDIMRLRAHRMGNQLLERSLQHDAFFVLSDTSAKEMLSERVPQEKLWRYRYFFDLPQTPPVPSAERSGFLYVGRFQSQKNVPGLIEAFADFHSQHPEIHLTIVGTGPKEHEVVAARSASPAKDAIMIKGWVDEPMQLYRQAIAMVSASRSEGLSNVMIESLSAGTPVIMADISGVRDALDVDPSIPIGGDYLVGRGGLIIKPGDQKGFVKAMEALLSNKDLHQQLINEAYSRAAHYMEGTSVPDFEHMARLILAGESAPAEERGFSPLLFEEKAG